MRGSRSYLSPGTVSFPLSLGETCLAPGVVIIVARAYRTLAGGSGGGDGKVKLRLAFDSLGLEPWSSEQQVRAAYISLVKLYHPDTNHQKASPEKFAKIKEAYMVCMCYLRNIKEREPCALASLEEEIEALVERAGVLRRRPVAHRHYLCHDVGPGTYSERERRHQQLRLDQAVDSVFEQRLRKSLENHKDKAVTVAATHPVQEQRMTQALERLADDLIREAMARGEFDRLPGQGRPLTYSMPNVALDDMSSKINQMLISSGFKPEWITLEQELRNDLKKLKEKIAASWFGLGLQPMTRDKWTEWEALKMEYIMPDLKSLNLKVDHFNLIVPIMSRQLPHFDMGRLIKKAIVDHLQEGMSLQRQVLAQQQQTSQDRETMTRSKWKDIWDLLKSLFLR